MKNWVWATVALTALGACETQAEMEAAGNASAKALYDGVHEANLGLTESVLDMPVTDAADLPTTGAAVYDGYAGLGLDTKSATSLLGEAELTADFRHGTLTGVLDDFVGQVNGGAYKEFDGSLDIRRGSIGAVSGSGFAADVTGELSRGVDHLMVDGGLTGDFHSRGGDEAVALRGITTPDTVFTLNGTDYAGGISVVGSR